MDGFKPPEMIGRKGNNALVIFMTGRIDPEDETRGFKPWLMDRIEKPIKKEVLLFRAKRIFEWNKKAYNGIIYTPRGKRIQIKPEEGYTFYVTDLNGEQKELSSRLNWNLMYSAKDGQFNVVIQIQIFSGGKATTSLIFDAFVSSITRRSIPSAMPAHLGSFLRDNRNSSGRG